jgi:hypothetical protein
MINNPYKYSFQLIKAIKTPDYETIKYYAPFTQPTLNITEFKIKYSEKSLTDKEILDYVFYHKNLGGKVSERFFICHLIFGAIQFLAALIAYNLKNFYGKWKMDVLPLIMVNNFINIFSLNPYPICRLFRFLRFGFS